jgi:YceI-like protein
MEPAPPPGGMEGVKRRKQLVIGVLALAGLCVIAVTILGAANFLAGQRRAAAFSLSPTSAPRTSPSASPPLPTTLQQACRLRATAPRGMDIWTAVAGTQAGYRAREKFAEIELPHEAVARTDHVAGQLQIVQADASQLVIQDGCFAVELETMTSIDSLPGIKATDRDGLYRDILETGLYPFAILKLDRTTIPAFTSTPQRVTVAGDLTIMGTTRRTTMTVQAQAVPSGVQAVGSLSLDARDYGVHLPGEGDSPIVVDPHLTLEFLLTLERLPSAGTLQEAQ